MLPQIAEMAQCLRDCLQRGGKILLMGNGGSAADCQHIAAEIVGRYKCERRGLPAMALTADTSILTSVGNDFGFDHIFSRQVEALCNPADVVIGISTSGNSGNGESDQKAGEIGAITVAMAGGTGGKLANLCDFCLVIPSSDTRAYRKHIFLSATACAICWSLHDARHFD